VRAKALAVSVSATTSRVQGHGGDIGPDRFPPLSLNTYGLAWGFIGRGSALRLRLWLTGSAKATCQRGELPNSRDHLNAYRIPPIYNGFTAASDPTAFDFMGRFVYARLGHDF